VTGSKHLLETQVGTRVLLDCGLYQGLPELEERNWTPPPVDPRHLDAVFLSHAHLDHCGYLPALCAQGFRGPIYCTSATADVAELVLRDAAGLQEDEARRARRHPERHLHATPLYTDSDVDKVANQFVRIAYGEQRSDVRSCSLCLRDAGHILGSAIMEIECDGRRLVFSGDLGRYGRPLLHDPTPIAHADAVLCESTYGDRLHPPDDPRDDLGKVISAALARRGVLVIPSFAVGRTQEILYAIAQLQAAGAMGDVPIYVDSPMAIAADRIMERHPEALRFDLRARFGRNDDSIGARHVTNVEDAANSRALNDIQSDAIIIASSGMASGGRILHHLRNRLPRPQDTICFVGFQSPGTLGQQLLNGHKEVRIFGIPIPVRAAIAHVDGFSAHADREELLRWFGGFVDRPRTFIVHADPAAARALAAAVAARYGLVASPAQPLETAEV
jgi:metallo-beta-lactamase family protein